MCFLRLDFDHAKNRKKVDEIQHKVPKNWSIKQSFFFNISKLIPTVDKFTSNINESPITYNFQPYIQTEMEQIDSNH